MNKVTEWVLVKLSSHLSINSSSDVLMPKHMYNTEMGTIIQHLTNEDEKVKSHWNVSSRRVMRER